MEFLGRWWGNWTIIWRAQFFCGLIMFSSILNNNFFCILLINSKIFWWVDIDQRLYAYMLIYIYIPFADLRTNISLLFRTAESLCLQIYGWFALLKFVAQTHSKMRDLVFQSGYKEQVLYDIQPDNYANTGNLDVECKYGGNNR